MNNPTPTPRSELIEAALHEVLDADGCRGRRDTFEPGSGHWLALNGEYAARKQVAHRHALEALSAPAAVGAPVVEGRADTLRLDKLEKACSREYVDKSCEFDFNRMQFVLPFMLSQNCIGGEYTLREAIDLLKES